MNRFGDYEYSLAMKEHHAKELAKRAKAGDTAAQYELANFYYNGSGSTQNYKKAAEWFKKAAKKGNEDAKRRMKKALELSGTEYITGNTLNNMTPEERKYAEGLQMRKVFEIEGEA
ncbi:MAG: hypothetical protein FWD58_01270 [Firmicutes bacterium]|nr:hypothetical protein [Bacillota bacterium]